ncbi:MAG: CBS domain-containing protein, partial [Planctomycetales bacterium]
MSVTLQHILQQKGTQVYSTTPDATLQDVVHQLLDHGVGSLLVCGPACDDGSPNMVGIITERDVLKACAKAKPLDQVSVESAMTTEIVTGKPEDLLEHAMSLMTTNRMRHLPVVDENGLRGLISIGDLIKAELELAATENHHLKHYIYGADPE